MKRTFLWASCLLGSCQLPLNLNEEISVISPEAGPDLPKKNNQTKTSSHPIARIQVKYLAPYHPIAKYHFTCYTASLTLQLAFLPLHIQDVNYNSPLYLFDISELGWNSKARLKKKKKSISYLNFSSSSFTAWGKSSGWFHFIPTAYFFFNLPPCPCTCYIDVRKSRL